jgi:hypothetical protein
MIRTCLKAALGAAVAAAAALTFALPASAAPLSVSGTTYLPDSGDSGNGAGNNGIPFIDAFHRTLTVTASSDACAVPVNGLTCYTATISDSGTFTTIPGNGNAPNPNSATDPGTNIAYPPVSGPFTGSATYVFQTSATPSVTNIPNVVNNHGAHVNSGPHSTSDWFVNAFSSSAEFYNSEGLPVTVGSTNDDVLQNTWGWTYTTMTGGAKHTNPVACETWADSFSNGAGDGAGDGNITGRQCTGTPKVHYTRVPNCIDRRVYVCTQLLSGRGLRWSLDTVRRPDTAYFVRSTQPAVGSVVLQGSVVKIQDVRKSGL